jgi:hypothetical protein
MLILSSVVILPRFDSSRTSHPNVTKAGTEVSTAKGDLYTDGARTMPGPVDINDVFAWENAARYRAAGKIVGKPAG